MELISVQQLVSGDRYEGKVRAFEVLARGAAQEPEGWRRGVAGVRDAVSEEKQKVKEDRRKKLETLDNSRVRLESLLDLEAIVRLRKQKRSRKRVRPKEPEPEPSVPAESVDAARFLQAVLENQVPMIDRYLADGGDPDVHDQAWPPSAQHIPVSLASRWALPAPPLQPRATLLLSWASEIIDPRPRLCPLSSFQFRCTALHWACLRGHAEIVDKLLAAGARLEPRDMLEATPMLWACRGGHLDVLQRLLDRGAKISTRDKQLRSTALHVAVRTGHYDCAEHLIACGAEIDAQDKEGDTPIHDAIRLGRFKAVKTLLMYGANLSIRNQEALRPVDLVKDWQRGIRQTLQALLFWGQTPLSRLASSALKTRGVERSKQGKCPAQRPCQTFSPPGPAARQRVRGVGISVHWAAQCSLQSRHRVPGAPVISPPWGEGEDRAARTVPPSNQPR